MLVELRLVEQRYRAVLEVLNDGAAVTDLARRYGVARQTVHEWLKRYASHTSNWIGARHAARQHSLPWTTSGTRTWIAKI